jgi:hypothetical protein
LENGKCSTSILSGTICSCKARRKEAIGFDLFWIACRVKPPRAIAFGDKVGRPIVSKLNQIRIGADVETQHRNDAQSEYDAVKSYNDGIKLAMELGDNGTRELLEHILKDEEDHVDWLEAQLDQIRQMGVAGYLVEQID